MIYFYNFLLVLARDDEFYKAKENDQDDDYEKDENTPEENVLEEDENDANDIYEEESEELQDEPEEDISDYEKTDALLKHINSLSEALKKQLREIEDSKKKEEIKKFSNILLNFQKKLSSPESASIKIEKKVKKPQKIVVAAPSTSKVSKSFLTESIEKIKKQLIKIGNPKENKFDTQSSSFRFALKKYQMSMPVIEELFSDLSRLNVVKLGSEQKSLFSVKQKRLELVLANIKVIMSILIKIYENLAVSEVESAQEIKNTLNKINIEIINLSNEIISKKIQK